MGKTAAQREKALRLRRRESRTPEQQAWLDDYNATKEKSGLRPARPVVTAPQPPPVPQVIFVPAQEPGAPPPAPPIDLDAIEDDVSEAEEPPTGAEAPEEEPTEEKPDGAVMALMIAGIWKTALRAGNEELRKMEFAGTLPDFVMDLGDECIDKTCMDLLGKTEIKPYYVAAGETAYVGIAYMALRKKRQQKQNSKPGSNGVPVKPPIDTTAVLVKSEPKQEDKDPSEPPTIAGVFYGF